MAHYHFTVKPVSRGGGKSTVAKLAYRSATDLKDLRNGETYYHSDRWDVFHVDILLPEGAPQWVVDIALECKTDRQSALQKFSDIIEAAEKRINSRVYREVEFALPNELTNEQNIDWSKEFVKDFFCKKGMVAIVNYHGEVDEKTGIYKPHCHVLLSTRNLAEQGFSSHKNRDWDSDELVEEWREQFANYQNAALKEHGFDVRVTHLSYEDRELDIDAQTKLGQNVREMTARGIGTDKQRIFDLVRLKNQFKIVKNPEIVFKIVTSMHSTFTRKDIAKVLHRYIDDAQQFQLLLDRLMTSKELVNLESSGIHRGTDETVYTTQEMLRIEVNLVRQAENLSVQKTHVVDSKIVENVIAKHHEKFKKHGGLSPDQEAAIRHMLKGNQISCIVGFAGAGKTTCLEAVREAWEEAGYKIIGLAPTGKAARNIEGCGIRSMTIHKFLFAQGKGRERISAKTIIVGDEFGMVDSRRCSELLSLVNKTGAKIVPMGDGNQAQSVEAGPAFRLLTEKAKPAVLEKIVRQQTEWQRDATRLFGTLHSRSALKLYQENGCFTTIQEQTPDFNDNNCLLDNFCLARQVSGRIWQEMKEDFKAEFGTDASGTGTPGKDVAFDPAARQEIDFETLSTHQDFKLFKEWKKTRQSLVTRIITHYDSLREDLKEREVNLKVLDSLVAAYKAAPFSVATVPDPVLFQDIESLLRQMSYKHIADTRVGTREALVKAWAKDYQASPDESHLMLAFTNKDANKLNIDARTYMREQGKIQGKDYEFVTQRIETDEFDVERRSYHDRTFAKGDRILFTRNNNSLNVKNGSLGTILEISKSKITVALDTEGEEQETVSFSPKLYPFIDNGWATTIIKAQGVTVDHTKLLASFEQYRNLAYVGMSRHRKTLQVFCSSLDFWRPEKIIDRLSRIQEKLSGFDYLDANKIQEKLTEDTEILWHHQKIQQGKDFWKAIKVTARDVFDKALGRPQGEKEKEEFLTFEDSEEMRSRDFFEDSSNAQGKGAFGREREEDSTSVSGKAKTTPKQPSYANEDKKAQESNRSSHHLSEKLASLDQPSQPKGKEQPAPGYSPSKAQTSTVQQEKQDDQSLDFSKDSMDDKIKAIKEKIKGDYNSKVIIKEKPLLFKEVEGQLKERMFDLATAFIDKPITLNTPRELRFGKDREIRVVLSGKYQGFYHNFETGIKGGPLKLIEDQQGLTPKDALKRAAEWLGGSHIVIERHATVKKKEAGKDKVSEWTPIIPVPKDQENPDIASNKYLNVMLRDGWQEGARYAYHDDEGNLKGYVIRLEKPNGDKVDKRTPPLAYCENEKGQKAWRWLGFEKENKTPYRIEVLSQDPAKPILVVEGEKTADAAQKLLPEYHVLTWSGGAGNIDKTNWQCLIGKTVVIWPDYDYNQAGQEAAQKLQKIISQLNKSAGKDGRVEVVDLLKHLLDPHDFPDKWDLADRLPEGWDIQTVRDVLNKTIGHELQKTSEVSIQQGMRKEINNDHQDQNTQTPSDSSIIAKSKIDVQREAFEASRLSFHQEWCATFGFMEQHKRFPQNGEELSAAYWQGERLTAIEGRMYKEVLDRGGRVNEKQLTLNARKKLSKNQGVLNHILMLGKASNLTEDQLKQFEQHALIHRDRANQFPNPSELESFCQAIKAHSQMISTAKVDSLLEKQDAKAAHTQEVNLKPHEVRSSRTLIYRHLIEQQAVLAHIKNDKEISFTTLKTNQIQVSCAEKLNRMDEKIRSISKFSEEMKALDLNRQNQRGIDL